MRFLSLFATFLALTSINAVTASDRINSRIIGGNDTAIRSAPFYAAILFRGVPICGGAFIKNSAVVTTASCLNGYRPNMLQVQLGSSTPGDGEIVPVARFCNHPSFNISGPAADYDVAVVILAKYVYTTTVIQMIPIRAKNLDVPTGKLGTVVGFGTAGFGGPRNKNLQSLELPRVGDIKCQRSYPYDELSDRMVCFGYEEGGKDACNAGGSPLIFEGALVGLDSWSYGCAFPNSPRVFTRIYNEDIYNHIYPNTC